MKHKVKNNADFSRLKTKMFLQALGMVIIAFVVIVAIYNSIWRGKGGNWLVSVLQKYFPLGYYEALNIYRQVFRDNIEIIWIVSVSIVFFILFRISLIGFTKYFNEINNGIDKLLKDDGKEIVLSEEMFAIEKKLNTVRQTLEKRAFEAQLAEQRKDDLVMYLAHDIRTPLTSVIGYLSLLDEAPDMPPEQKAKYVHITLDKANRLEKLINEFFEITRYNLQHIILEKETIDLYFMLVQLIDEFYPILSSKGNRAVIQVDESLTIYGDPEKLARVFNNIMKNAVAYSYSDTEIIISAEKKDNSVVITFQNQGQTIPSEKLSTIFEKFYRMDEARTSVTGGSGLGLAIAKEIVTLHEGTITAQSKDNTVTFIVSLPLTD